MVFESDDISAGGEETAEKSNQNRKRMPLRLRLVRMARTIMQLARLFDYKCLQHGLSNLLYLQPKGQVVFYVA